MIWGESDKTFPLKLANDMKNQFVPACGIKIVNDASLLPHEEKPKEVCDSILHFLSNTPRSKK